MTLHNVKVLGDVIGLVLILFLASLIIGGLIDALLQAHRRNHGRPRW